MVDCVSAGVILHPHRLGGPANHFLSRYQTKKAITPDGFIKQISGAPPLPSPTARHDNEACLDPLILSLQPLPDVPSPRHVSASPPYTASCCTPFRTAAPAMDYSQPYTSTPKILPSLYGCTKVSEKKISAYHSGPRDSSLLQGL